MLEVLLVVYLSLRAIVGLCEKGVMGAIIWLLSLKPLLSAYFEKPSDLTARLSRKFRDLRKCLIVFFFFQDLQKEGEYFLF